MAAPSLIPVPPARGTAVSLGGVSPIWIGSEVGVAVRVLLPGVAAKHVGLIEREDGWWAVPGNGPAMVNGVELRAARRLDDGDVLTVVPGHTYKFASGAAVAPSPATPRAPSRKRKPDRIGVPLADRLRALPLGMLVTAAIAITLLAGAGVAIWYAATRAGHSPALLTDQQAIEFDSLLSVAYDHVERGNTLMELGLADAAAREFARGVNTLALSDLGSHPQVKPRIEALEASIATIYREQKVAVPKAYAGATTKLSPDQLRAASLSVPQFAEAFADVERAFASRYGGTITVTGRDHPEHVSLYGRGGALDLRTRGMAGDQVRFVVDACRQRGIRVKDFSQDSILQLQVAAAKRAGLLDRAGTGLHLHIDRFAGRRDRWTVTTSGRT
jgi:hypothetical protein